MDRLKIQAGLEIPPFFLNSVSNYVTGVYILATVAIYAALPYRSIFIESAQTQRLFSHRASLHRVFLRAQ